MEGKPARMGKKSEPRLHGLLVPGFGLLLFVEVFRGAGGFKKTVQWEARPQWTQWLLMEHRRQRQLQVHEVLDAKSTVKSILVKPEYCDSM